MEDDHPTVNFQRNAYSLVSELKKILMDHNEIKQNNLNQLTSVLILMKVLKTLRATTDQVRAYVFANFSCNTKALEFIEEMLQQQGKRTILEINCHEILLS